MLAKGPQPEDDNDDVGDNGVEDVEDVGDVEDDDVDNDCDNVHDNLDGNLDDAHQCRFTSWCKRLLDSPIPDDLRLTSSTQG